MKMRPKITITNQHITFTTTNHDRFHRSRSRFLSKYSLCVKYVSTLSIITPTTKPTNKPARNIFIIPESPQAHDQYTQPHQPLTPAYDK